MVLGDLHRRVTEFFHFLKNNYSICEKNVMHFVYRVSKKEVIFFFVAASIKCILDGLWWIFVLSNCILHRLYGLKHVEMQEGYSNIGHWAWWRNLQCAVRKQTWHQFTFLVYTVLSSALQFLDKINTHNLSTWKIIPLQ